MLDISARRQKSWAELDLTKILTLPINEKFFCKVRKRFGMISGRNIKGTSLWKWVSTVPFVKCLCIFNTRTSGVKSQELQDLVLGKLCGMYLHTLYTVPLC